MAEIEFYFNVWITQESNPNRMKFIHVSNGLFLQKKMYNCI